MCLGHVPGGWKEVSGSGPGLLRGRWVLLAAFQHPFCEGDWKLGTAEVFVGIGFRN